MACEQGVIRGQAVLPGPAKRLGSVSQVCSWRAAAGTASAGSRKLCEEGGEAAPQEPSRRKPNLKNRIGLAIGAAEDAATPL